MTHRIDIIMCTETCKFQTKFAGELDSTTVGAIFRCPPMWTNGVGGATFCWVQIFSSCVGWNGIFHYFGRLWHWMRVNRGIFHQQKKKCFRAHFV